MFNQVLVHPSDQVYHRFLWRRDSILETRQHRYGIERCQRLGQRLTEFQEAAKELLEHTYVDDIGGSKPTVDEAVQVTCGIDKILGKGQF